MSAEWGGWLAPLPHPRQGNGRLWALASWLIMETVSSWSQALKSQISMITVQVSCWSSYGKMSKCCCQSQPNRQCLPWHYSDVHAVAALCFKRSSALLLAFFSSSSTPMLHSLIKRLLLKRFYATVVVTTSFFAQGVVERAIHYR